MTNGIISDVTWVKVDKDGTAVERSDIFNDMMEGCFPSHFAPVGLGLGHIAKNMKKNHGNESEGGENIS